MTCMTLCIQVALLLGLPMAQAYSSGAGSCNGPAGSHGGGTTYSATSHAAITHSPSNPTAGSTVTVTLTAGSGAGTFKGFLLKVPSADATFSTTPSLTKP